MKELAKMYMKLVLLAFIPILLIIIVAAFFITMIPNETVMYIATFLFGIFFGLPVILYINWLADRFF